MKIETMHYDVSVQYTAGERVYESEPYGFLTNRPGCGIRFVGTILRAPTRAQPRMAVLFEPMPVVDCCAYAPCVQ